jgi:hypothetical protein
LPQFPHDNGNGNGNGNNDDDNGNDVNRDDDNGNGNDDPAAHTPDLSPLSLSSELEALMHHADIALCLVPLTAEQRLAFLAGERCAKSPVANLPHDVIIRTLTCFPVLQGKRVAGQNQGEIHTLIGIGR